APDDELTPWAAAKVKDKMLMSLNWKVNDIDSLKVYQVFDNESVLQFMNTTLKDTYRELVYPLKDVSTWEAPNDLQQVLPLGTHRQKRMSNKTHMTQEHLTAEALLDEEQARNGRIYQDWYDLEAQEPKIPWQQRTNVNSCPTQIVLVPFTEDAMRINVM
nr:hypothetical protein [Tanacetum cinerariifolium]